MKTLFFYFTLFFVVQTNAQNQHKIIGFLGLYHTNTGYAFVDYSGIDSCLLQHEFNFGELAIPNQNSDNGFVFNDDVDSCNLWKVNKVYGIIQPPSEGGISNQPFDTSIFSPFDISKNPGMVQGGHRFSELSKKHGAFCGAVLDDWNGDIATTQQVHYALIGKQLDANGNVITESIASTPYNKLFIVRYDTWYNYDAYPIVDGVSYWYYFGQNCCYTNLDSDITVLRNNWRNKEILIGIYIFNGHLGWTDPVGVHYMLQHSLDRYDDGEINGITLFAGPYLIKNTMPLSQWKALALPHWLDSLYYPYLGEAEGRLFDCNTGTPLTDAFVRVLCKGRISGDILSRGTQKTDSSGIFHFGLWAGNRNTDSTLYWAIAQKDGYDNDTIYFWIKRNAQTNIPNNSLCVSKNTTAINTNEELFVYPNPAGEYINIFTKQNTGGEIEILDLLGRINLLQNITTTQTTIDVKNLKSGFYIIRLRNGNVATKKFMKE